MNERRNSAGSARLEAQTIAILALASGLAGRKTITVARTAIIGVVLILLSPSFASTNGNRWIWA